MPLEVLHTISCTRVRRLSFLDDERKPRLRLYLRRRRLFVGGYRKGQRRLLEGGKMRALQRNAAITAQRVAELHRRMSRGSLPECSSPSSLWYSATMDMCSPTRFGYPSFFVFHQHRKDTHSECGKARSASLTTRCSHAMMQLCGRQNDGIASTASGGSAG